MSVRVRPPAPVLPPVFAGRRDARPGLLLVRAIEAPRDSPRRTVLAGPRHLQNLEDRDDLVEDLGPPRRGQVLEYGVEAKEHGVVDVLPPRALAPVMGFEASRLNLL